jgi:hypothetical protein
MANNGPTFTKATYDHKRTRSGPPSPGRVDAELEEARRTAAKGRKFDTRYKKDGLYEALREIAPDKFPELPKPPTITRRKI